MTIPGLSANRGRLAFSLPLLAALVILTPLVFDEPSRFDEGFVVSGAMMVRRGWVPVRDFFVIYGPGQFYLLAAMYELFGEDLLVSRIVHAMTLGLLALSVASRTLALSGGSRLWASFTAAVFVLMAAYADPSASYPAVPAALLLVWSSFAYERWFASRLARHVVVASLLVGCAALFRWDFGMLGAFALAAATAAVCYSRGSTARSIIRDVALALIPFTILTSIGYGPLLLAGDASRWFDEVPLFHAREFEYWRGRPFIGPQLHALAEAVVAKNHLSFAHAFTKLVFAMTPIVLVGATFITVGTQLIAEKRTLTKEAALALFVALLALGLLNQMRVRPGLWQGFPALAVSLPLIAYLGRRAYLRLGAQPGVKIGGQLAIALVLVLIPAYATKDRLVLAFSGMRTPIQLPKASFAYVDPRSVDRWSKYAEMIQYVRTNTGPIEPIFSGVKDTTRLLVNDAILYFMADRPAATRWIEMEPGLTNTPAGQLEVIRDLERYDVRMVILWDTISNEPNATSRSNGIHILDEYIRENYRQEARFGDYVVMHRAK